MTATAFAITDDLDDDLGGFFADAGREVIPVAERVAVEPIPTSAFTETCRKCNGSGRFVRGYSFSGQCFACKGKGKLSFATSPEQRAAGRASKANRKADNVEAFAKENPDAAAWMKAASARGFQFGGAMLEVVGKFGHLTERQMASVLKCMAGDAARDERRAAEAKERAEREAAASAIDITRIVAKMAHAMEKGIKRPILRLDTFRFSQKWPLLYVRDAADTDRYLGKIENGKFIRSRECSAEEEARILAAAADPETAARTYGRVTGNCCCCGRELTNKESLDLGIGPICAGKFGL